MKLTIENIWNRDSMAAVFTRSYIECGLWCEGLDGNYDLDDLANETIEKAVSDCETFIQANESWFCNQYEQAGYDFYLTRNGHGAGFWERPETYGGQENADFLTKAANEFKECVFIIGDNGKVYQE